ncbi:MAG: hypothetical protein HWN80_10635 [Candidatus Lokiarchaeota archaeon]|nr:hypothetical protein [Candidatus Lokiarchaeota archaeon]
MEKIPMIVFTIVMNVGIKYAIIALISANIAMKTSVMDAIMIIKKPVNK